MQQQRESFYATHTPPAEPPAVSFKKAFVAYRLNKRRYDAAKEGKVSKSAVWFACYKTPVIVIGCILIVAVIILLSIFIPIATDIFRVSKVSKIEIGYTTTQVRRVLGTPTIKNDNTWEYYDKECASLVKKLNDNYTRQEQALAGGNLSQVEKLQSSAQEIEEELNNKTYKYIRITFDLQGNAVVGVLLDCKRNNSEADKSKTAKDIQVNPKEVYCYTDNRTSKNIAWGTNSDSIVYSAEYTDGSYNREKINEFIIESKSIKFTNNFGEYSVEIDIKSIGSISRSGEWVMHDKSITEFTVPDSVTSIGDNAFSGCKNLANIILPQSVNSIGSGAFNGCSCLTSITLPKSLTHIGDMAFSGCNNLVNIPLPQSVTDIGTQAFNGCGNLTSIIIPQSVTSIGLGVFSGCANLTSITVESGNRVYHSSGNCIIETSYKTLIAGCKSSVIPVDESIRSIRNGAFYSCHNLTEVTIPNGVTSIGSAAFYDCSDLTTIVIPDSITSIGDNAFIGCNNLTTATIPTIALSTISKSNLQIVIINKGTSISEFEFGSCSKLTSVTLPDSVAIIGKGAFSGCNNLTNIIIPNSVTSIEDDTFSSCNSLTSITIPDSLTSIGDYVFAGCGSLTNIIIPESVTSIGEYAFEWCKDLTSIIYKGTIEQWSKLSKGSNWNYDTGNYIVHCTDGDISK